MQVLDESIYRQLERRAKKRGIQVQSLLRLIAAEYVRSPDDPLDTWSARPEKPVRKVRLNHNTEKRRQRGRLLTQEH